MKKGFVFPGILLIISLVFTSALAAFFVARVFGNHDFVSPIVGSVEKGSPGEVEGASTSAVPVEADNVPAQTGKNALVGSGSGSQETKSSTSKSEAQTNASILNNLSVSGDVHLSSVDPGGGKVGDSVMLRGSGFGSRQGGVLFFGGADDSCCFSQAESWSDNEIKVAVANVSPKGAKKIGVWTADGKLSNLLDFELTAGVPTIESFWPEKFVAGEFITIYGSEFGATGGHVNFYGSDGQLVGECVFGAGALWNAGWISCMVPPELGSGEYSLEVVTDDGLESVIKQVSIE